VAAALEEHGRVAMGLLLPLIRAAVAVAVVLRQLLAVMVLLAAVALSSFE
jgi:fructose-specific phosphotransferase system IIC component